MPDDPTRTLSLDERVREVLSAYQEARARGQAPPVSEVLARHPDLAEQLGRLLSAGAGSAETLDHPGSHDSEPDEPLDPGAPTIDAPGPAPGGALPFPAEFGDFELLEEIARGGMGVIFRARQKSLHRIVALKMILAGQLASAEQVRRFHIEAEEAGNLDHPNIVPIYQVGEEQGHHYFAMKLIEGGPLSAQMKPFHNDIRASVRLVATVARAVHYAHQRGILHRDVKPGNILLDTNGTPLITDFGLAKHLTGPASTQSGAVVGTPAYMAPEQAAAAKDLSVAVDVYSLGAVLYDLLTGRPPFQADTSLSILLQVMERDPEPPRALNPRIHRDLETICLKCLEKDPQRRYGSALRLAEDLDRYLKGEPIQARPVGRLERTGKWIRRRPAAAALLAVSLLAVATLALSGWWFSGQLQAALSKAEERRQAAEDQRQQVASAFRKRLDVAEDFLLRMDGRLSRSGAPDSVRVEFVHDILKMSEGLLRENPDDPAARRQTAQLARTLGDLWRDGRNYAEAQTPYRRALQLYQGLVNEFPGNSEDVTELAVTHAHQAELYLKLRQYPEGKAAFAEAIRLQDVLANSHRPNFTFRWRGAYYRFRQANLQEEAGEVPEAEQTYREALKRQEQLVADQPEESRFHADLATTAFGLASLLSETDPEQALPFWRRQLDGCRRAKRLAPTVSRYASNLHEAYFDLARALQRQGKHEAFPLLAEELRQDFPNNPNETYNAACLMGLAADATRRDKSLAPAERQRLADDYGARGVKFLHMAVLEGYRDRGHLDRDPDLDTLRPREDYQKLVAELDRRSPAPPTPAKQLAALQKEYQDAYDTYDYYRRTAETVAQQKKARTKQPRFVPFGQRFLRFAGEHRDDPAAVEALVWLLERTTPREGRPTAPSIARLREQALAALERDHLQKPELALVCRQLSESPAPDCGQLLRAALERHAVRDVRGLAGYALALSLAKQAGQARERGYPEAAEQVHAAEKQLQQVQELYASVPFGRTTLGEVARDKLYELRNLSVGRPALEIEGEDLAGRPMKLSDHRGKVVVLDFWADWCGYCRQMYPHERALVRRLEGKPFVLLGVNCDDDKAQATRAVSKEGLNWRSWWGRDQKGGPVSDRWQVEAFPTIFVLDAEGVIRYKFEGYVDKELDAAVDHLLREAEAKKGKEGR